MLIAYQQQKQNSPFVQVSIQRRVRGGHLVRARVHQLQVPGSAGDAETGRLRSAVPTAPQVQRRPGGDHDEDERVRPRQAATDHQLVQERQGDSAGRKQIQDN